MKKSSFVTASSVAKEPAMKNLLSRIENMHYKNHLGKKEKMSFTFTAPIRGVNTAYKNVFVELSKTDLDTLFDRDLYAQALNELSLKNPQELSVVHFPWTTFEDGASGLKIKYSSETDFPVIDQLPQPVNFPVSAKVTLTLGTYANYPSEEHYGISAKLVRLEIIPTN